MAFVFIAVAGQHGTNARNFYGMFREEPVKPSPNTLSITQTPILIRPPSLSRLMAAIAEKRRAQDIIVVSHGSPTQLALRVHPNIPLGTDGNMIDALLGDESDRDLAERIRQPRRSSPISAVRQLRRNIQAVQQMQLARVEIRGCLIGQQVGVLTKLKQLFGAASICAPRRYDGYGKIQGLRPTTNASALQDWQNAHPDHQSFGSNGNRFFWVCDGSTDPPTISHAFAESWDAVRQWATAKNMTDRTHNFERGEIYYHVMIAEAESSSHEHGSRTFQNDFLFPNDAGYRDALRRVT